MKQKLIFLRNILLKRKTFIFLGLSILAIFFIQQQFSPNINLVLLKNNIFFNSGNIALASPACNPDACAYYGTICCPGIESCIKWWEDEQNCGSCGNRCPAGSTCQLKVPGDYTKGASCQGCDAAACGYYGLICCSGVTGCVNWLTDSNNCGGCGIRCGTGYKCSSGKCVDGTAPSISITNPLNRATVSGTVNLETNVADPQSPVEWVKFSIKKRYTTTTTEICVDTSFPYSCSWDTTKFADASYYIYASAKSAGGTGQRSITVTVKNGGVCVNDCSPSGTKRCDPSNSTRYQSCGDYDTDSCLEWSSSTACPSGQTCSGGVCGGTFGAPTLVEPINGSEVSSSPTFKWSKVSGATQYGVWVSENSNMSSTWFWGKTAYSTNCATTTCSLDWLSGSGWQAKDMNTKDGITPQSPKNLTAGKTYYWLVWACKSSTDCPLAGVSATNNFRIKMGAISVPDPAENLTIVSQNCTDKGVEVTFSWTLAGKDLFGDWVRDAQWLDLSTQDNKFTSGTFKNTNNPPFINDNSYRTGAGKIGPLNPGVTHYWRINTHYMNDQWLTSDVATFTTNSCGLTCPSAYGRCPVPTMGWCSPATLSQYFHNNVCQASAICYQESRGNPWSQNPYSGARGLFQILKSTAESNGLDYNKLFDPVYNIQGAVKISSDGLWWSPWAGTGNPVDWCPITF